jgi:2-keto-4-pentenoate hydratase
LHHLMIKHIIIFAVISLMISYSEMNVYSQSPIEPESSPRKDDAQNRLPSTMNPDLNLEDAYKIQSEKAERLLSGDAISGFKAALMDGTDQQVLGITRPIMSPTFKSGELNGNIIVNLSQFNQMSISQEIGFIVGKRIEKR